MKASCVWHGTATEWDQLTGAIKQNCTCGQRTYGFASRCTTHELLHEQHALDRLLFARRITARLLREEFLESTVDAIDQRAQDAT